MWYGWTGRNGRHGHGHTKYIAVVLSLHLTSYILHLGHDEVHTSYMYFLLSTGHYILGYILCFYLLITSLILDSGFAAVAGRATGQARRLFDFL